MSKKNLNKEFEEYQEKGVQNLVDNHEYHTATNHAVFSADKLNFPEGITAESIAGHMKFINDLSLQAEVATSQIARSQYEKDNSITTVDGTLKFEGVEINSIHHLRQNTGKGVEGTPDYIYGVGTTAVDFAHNQVQADWISTQRTSDQALAEKLFG